MYRLKTHVFSYDSKSHFLNKNMKVISVALHSDVINTELNFREYDTVIHLITSTADIYCREMSLPSG